MVAMHTDNNKNFVGKFYNVWSKKLVKVNFFHETLAIHFGYYKKGIKSLNQAVINMKGGTVCHL